MRCNVRQQPAISVQFRRLRHFDVVGQPKNRVSAGRLDDLGNF